MKTIKKIITQKSTGKRVEQLAAVSILKKRQRNFYSGEKGLEAYKRSVTSLAEQIRDRKRAIDPIRILFVCPHGIGFSPATSLFFNALAKEVGVADLVWSSSDTIHLDGIARKDLGKVTYIVPRYNDLKESIVKNLYKAKGGTPQIIENKTLAMSTLTDEKSYMKFMLDILKRIAKSHSRLPSKKEDVRKQSWKDMPWGRD